MNIFISIYETILCALFPETKAQLQLFSYTEKECYKILERSNKLPYPNMFSVYAYKDKRVTSLVWNIKYKKSKQGTKIAGYALYEEIKANPYLHQDLIIIPIPITKKRQNERGYNQCHLLTDEIERLNIADTNNGYKHIYEKDLLVRVHHDTRHTLKNRKDRLVSAQGIFGINNTCLEEKYPSRKGTVLIIDDVITTGSTTNEAIRTLHDAGFEKVYGLSLAH